MRSNTQNFSFIFKVWKVYKYFKQHVNPSYIYLLAYLYKYSHRTSVRLICKHLVWIGIYYDCKIWHNIVTKIMIHHAIRYNFFFLQLIIRKSFSFRLWWCDWLIYTFLAHHHIHARYTFMFTSWYVLLHLHHFIKSTFGLKGKYRDTWQA